MVAKVLELERRLAMAMQKRFPENEIAPGHFGELLTEYVVSGLSSPHLIAEIETGDEGKLWSNIWEAMLYRHLRSGGYALRNVIKHSAQHGPDFGVEHEGRTIWIEAIVPSPERIPTEWLEPPRPGGEIRVRMKPDKPRVLRCTAALAAKQKKFAKDKVKGIIGPNDCAVIAVNICRLSDYDIDGTGVSQRPLSMEAVFPIGPIGVPISLDGIQPGPAHNIPRFSVTNSNGSEILTDAFLDPAFANVSAVLQAHQKDMYQRDLIVFTIHNPLATNPMPRRLFGSRKEFVTVEHEGGYRATDILAEIT